MILYISTARRGLSQGEIIEILRQARSRNISSGVTGILLYDRVRFMEVLEGPAEAVEDTFNRIRNDSRHVALVKLEDKPITKRQFAGQAMAAYGTSEPDLAHSVEEIDGILAGLTDLTLRDHLKSFARIRAIDSDHSH
jgi:hypothetical protein